ncbi:hypothetical protein [Leptothermofonsia sichuanensis]|jgi:hypothetical protein|uniref:hypothetical protein n=1 Tax=Leptothermofonsia sichuanensis TaxID=2917832 RepID=UPI001EF12154|nr:hypothetical protein [Leptothermofonsia sichuanensis]
MMVHLSWHHDLLILSFFAAIAGLLLLLTDKRPDASDPEGTNRVLLMMSFAYWLVHCLAVGLQKLILPEWELVLTSIKLTSALSYLLTVACVLSLPLHRASIRTTE